MPWYGEDLVIPERAVHEMLWEQFSKFGNDIAMIEDWLGERSLTYLELYHKSRKVAAYLQSVGVKKGDFVAIYTARSLEFTYVMIGVLGSGAIMTPCNPFYRKAEILHEFNISCPRIVFVEDELLEKMKSVKADVSYIEKLIVIGKSYEFMTVEEIISNPHLQSPRRVEINLRNDAAIAPRSSGTTGLPKCLLLSHCSIMGSIAIRFGDSEEINKRDSCHAMYIDRLLAHVSGFIMILKNLTNGLRIVITREYRLDEMLRLIEKHQATSTISVPPVLIEMANAKNSDKHDLSSLKLILSCGAALPPDVAQRVMKKYNVSILTTYGASEVGVVSSGIIQPGDISNSSGRLLENVVVKIVDTKTENECPTGCDGEIRVKSSGIMKGYYKNDAANARAFDKDGWFQTGDIGHFDEHGNIYITDRFKEIIQYRINQVSPAQLESVIISHPKVADVGVIGIPDERDGELPKAFVVPSDKSLTVEDVHKIVNENLVEYKHLHGGVEFVASIPKSATGKIRRDQLKKMAGI